MFGDSVKGEMALVNPRPPPFVMFRQTPPGCGIMMAKIVAVIIRKSDVRVSLEIDQPKPTGV